MMGDDIGTAEDALMILLEQLSKRRTIVPLASFK
jgi:hypothetical protein